jgi:HEAT repeat protein
MQPLITAAVDDRNVVPQAREIVRHAGDAAVGPLVIEAIELKYDGVEVAEQILGPRLVQQLITLTPQAQWYQLGPIVERLAKESDSRATEAVETALNRADEQSRREAAQGVAASGGANAAHLLEARVNDDSTEVAIIAVRAMAKYNVSGAAPILATRLDEIDVDGDDFLLAREIIGALARLDDPAAVTSLEKLAGRKALIKRGHFNDVQELAKQGLALQAKRGGGQ